MKSLFAKIFVGFLCVSVPAGVSAQKTVKLSASKANDYGVVYALPVTAFDVTVAAEKTVSTPGEFAQYAKKYLGVAPVLTGSTVWRVKEVAVNAVGVVDPEERYVATLKGGAGVTMVVDDQGRPISINDEGYVPQSVGMAVPVAVAPQPTVLEGDVARQAVTPEMIQSRSSAKKAELAANKIYELRSQRNEIIAGDAEGMPKDGAAMALALEQISAQEGALTAMFTGTEQRCVEVRTFRVTVPEDGAEMRSVVARLSTVGGIVDAGDLSGAPIYLTFKPLSRGEVPLDGKGVAKRVPKGGVAYRVPGVAEVSVTMDGERLFSGEFDVTQLGVVFGIEPGVFTDKKAPGYVRFNPLTGGIRELGTRSRE